MEERAVKGIGNKVMLDLQNKCIINYPFKSKSIPVSVATR